MAFKNNIRPKKKSFPGAEQEKKEGSIKEKKEKMATRTMDGRGTINHGRLKLCRLCKKAKELEQNLYELRKEERVMEKKGEKRTPLTRLEQGRVT